METIHGNTVSFSRIVSASKSQFEQESSISKSTLLI